MGDGQDVIAADNTNSMDCVQLFGNLTVGNISSRAVGNDRILSINGGAETLTLQNWVLGGGSQLNRFVIGGSNYHLAADSAR